MENAGEAAGEAAGEVGEAAGEVGEAAGEADEAAGEGTREAVRDAAAELARRISRRSVAWWRTETANGRTRADAIAELVGDLAELDQRLEGTERGRPRRPQREDVLVDQLAVVAYDLVETLTEDDRAGATALAQLLLTTYEVDPRPLPSDPVERALRAGGALGERLARLPRTGDGVGQG